ncbi:hypothetical protein ACQKP0_14090 [Heyndrickxia sp. NPDC080065]|uniref:hypothetical protein n=1 Tax=Heyndrickxia sp. NPDC080065 TaxID=3390568 RepID=UPI003CFD41DA
MHTKIKELVDFTRDKYNLNDYHLYEYQLYRKVNMNNETEYSLSMEWFPNHITKREDEDLNPDGTAVVEIDFHTAQTKSVIFVGGKSFVTVPTFKHFDINEAIKYIESETGLRYREQFQQTKTEDSRLHFQACIDGTPVSPSGLIEIECDDAGRLIHFSVFQPFPTSDDVIIESYSLALENVDFIVKEQLKLIEFPSDEQKKLVAVYGIEEIYITNNGISTLPFEFFVDTGEYINIDKQMIWNEPIPMNFKRNLISFQEDITIEQALSKETHPDTFPITNVDKCLSVVEDFLRQVYPDDTGKWILKTLHRDNGYIHATLRLVEQSKGVFQRKLLVMIDSKSLRVINYIDNEPLLEMFDSYEQSDSIKIDKIQAYERLKDLFELEPTYVYDRKKRNYILCGKLDCDYGIHASTGEVLLLNNL